ncbi:hypothetical protein [Actinacidiphila glaucinigra]|uniref:hypothetical protein n=1 Tax=Actinacidiphila glaucinigra TaxID=235986 RepID=UPI002E377018|nr:hypothetical protein [Actinacidiphila glaucinigra]
MSGLSLNLSLSLSLLTLLSRDSRETSQVGRNHRISAIVHGLDAAVTGDEEHAMTIARRLRIGQVDVNGGPHNFQARLGGDKQSATAGKWATGRP